MAGFDSGATPQQEAKFKQDKLFGTRGQVGQAPTTKKPELSSERRADQGGLGFRV